MREETKDSLSTGCTSTVHGCELHETSLTVSTSSAWVTGRLLHGEGGEKDGGNCMSAWLLVETEYNILPLAAPCCSKAQK
jgi:hypothetical protein